MKIYSVATVAAVALAAALLGPWPASAQAPQSLPTITNDAAPLPVAVSPTDSHIRYEGRFDFRDAAGPRCSWPASAVHLRYRGNALNVKLGESDNSDEYEVVIDGQPAAILVPRAGVHIYQVYSGTGNGPHTVTLVKRTEAFFGTSQFADFELPAGGTLVPLPRPSGRRLEVIGDSISCGYGNEAKDQHEHFSSTTENAYLSYGAVAARLLGAAYVCSAWSGRLMWPTNTMDSVYGLTLPTDPTSTWDFSRWMPQAVIICLGTNDFAGAVPNAADWEHGYEAFIARVRHNDPHAIIYCASSPMLWGDKDTMERADLHRIVSDENAGGDRSVRFLDIKTQDGSANGFGADWHPSVKTDAIMAQEVASVLESDLGWKPTTPQRSADSR